MAPSPTLTPGQERRRLLHDLLVGLLGSRNVYFQPPTNIEMKYPAIVYARDSSSTDYADNGPYRRKKRWTITHISRDPEDPVPDKIEDIPLCAFNRFFVAENMNHNVFNLYF